VNSVPALALSPARTDVSGSERGAKGLPSPIFDCRPAAGADALFDPPSAIVDPEWRPPSARTRWRSSRPSPALAGKPLPSRALATIGVLVLLQALAATRSAEPVTLDLPGGSLRGTVEEVTPNEVAIRANDKVQRIPLAVLKPAEVFACRCAVLDTSDAPGVLALVEYAQQNGLDRHAEKLLEAALREHADLYRAKYREVVEKNAAAAAAQPSAVKTAPKSAAAAPNGDKRAGDAPLPEEFLGPFPSWLDIKRDFGAVGDGKADDTEAFQKALAEFRKDNRPKTVLYVPAGTYRITATLLFPRQGHNDGQGTGVYGEDPEKCILRWDGPQDGAMLDYNAWYARLGRLTFDGAGKARTAIRHGPEFVTANEFSDLIVKNVAFGIEAGVKGGIAETTVIRCRFQRCSKAGISIQNWNSLDWFIWHSHFEDCDRGVTNVFQAGNFHVYECVFRNSTTADLSVSNTMYFSVRRNISIGSKAFFVAGGMGAGCPTAIEGNTVIGRETPIQIGNLGPVFLADNRLASEKAGPLVRLAAHTAAFSVGNVFAAADPAKAIAHGQRFLQSDDKAGALPPATVPPLVFAPRVERAAVEVRPGAGAPEIQKLIDQASAARGQRPVIHFPRGDFRMSQTLVIPPGSDVQLVGDGLQMGTHLSWGGKGAGPILRIAGSARATVRDLALRSGSEADAVVIEGDAPGSRVIARQIWTDGRQSAVRTLGLANTDVYLVDSGHSNSPVGLKVHGPGVEGMETRRSGRTIWYSGASSNNEYSYEVDHGGWLLVRDIWYESNDRVKFMKCTGAGVFCYHNGNAAHPRGPEGPSVLVDGFRGQLCFIGMDFSCVGGKGVELPAVVVKGETPETKLLLLGTHGGGDYLKNESATARVVRLVSNRFVAGGGASPIADVGAFDPAFVASMIAPTRNVHVPYHDPLPAEAGDVRLYRLCISGRNGLTVCAKLDEPK